jgi:hypothetical protein
MTRPSVWLALAAAIVAAPLSSSCSNPSPSTLTLAPAGMNATGKPFVFPNGAVTFWGPGKLQSKLHLEKGPVTITIRARGNQFANEWPIILIDLEARVVGKLTIDSSKLKDYSVTASVQNTGTTLLGVTFTNHAAAPQRIASRNLRIESVTIVQQPG